MEVFRVDHTTTHRRRLQAQKFYVKLIHKGVFTHNVEKAYEVLRSLQSQAILEAIKYFFKK